MTSDVIPVVVITTEKELETNAATSPDIHTVVAAALRPTMFAPLVDFLEPTDPDKKDFYVFRIKSNGRAYAMHFDLITRLIEKHRRDGVDTEFKYLPQKWHPSPQ